MKDWEPVVARWRQQYPMAHVKVVIGDPGGRCANPKIAWQRLLAEHAQGELWLWSDSDVLAPSGLLEELTAILLDPNVGAVTCGYRIKEALCRGETLDALFVNLEFLPGVLLLAKRGTIKFAFGACTLFRAEDFRQRVHWEKLGAQLADDYHLGRALHPVRVAPTLVGTFPQIGGFWASVMHYYRWHKTIRWCQPAGYFGILLLLPLLGWIACVLSGLNPIISICGLGTQYLIELCIMCTLVRTAGCTLSGGGFWCACFWPWIRALAWLSSWLPLPVQWGSKYWWSPVATYFDKPCTSPDLRHPAGLSDG